MVTDDGRACLSDVGMHTQLSKIAYIYNGAWPVPDGWMYKAREELLAEYDDPLDLVHTKAMDVYAFASTTYTVNSIHYHHHFIYLDISCTQIFTLKPPFNKKSYRRGLIRVLSGTHVLEKPAQITDALWDLLTSCWAPLPEDRPSMVEVKVKLFAIWECLPEILPFFHLQRSIFNMLFTTAELVASEPVQCKFILSIYPGHLMYLL